MAVWFWTSKFASSGKFILFLSLLLRFCRRCNCCRLVYSQGDRSVNLLRNKTDILILFVAERSCDSYWQVQCPFSCCCVWCVSFARTPLPRANYTNNRIINRTSSELYVSSSACSVHNSRVVWKNTCQTGEVWLGPAVWTTIKRNTKFQCKKSCHSRASSSIRGSMACFASFGRAMRIRTRA